jgi:hypothetical protein
VLTGIVIAALVVLGLLALSEGFRPQAFSRRRRGPWYFDPPSRKH